VVNVLSEEQNQLSEQYSLLSTKVRYLSQGSANVSGHQRDLEISRLQDEIIKLKSQTISHVTEQTQVIKQTQGSTYVSNQTLASNEIQNLNREIDQLRTNERALNIEISNFQNVMADLTNRNLSLETQVRSL